LRDFKSFFDGFREHVVASALTTTIRRPSASHVGGITSRAAWSNLRYAFADEYLFNHRESE
jgi:hypothetical protein